MSRRRKSRRRSPPAPGRGAHVDPPRRLPSEFGPSGLGPSGLVVPDYWSRTRHGAVNLLFLAPFLAVYLLCWWFVGEGVETQAAASLRGLLNVLGRKGLFVLSLVTCLVVCVVLLTRIRAAKADAVVFPGMLVEGLVYGFLLQIVAGALSRVLPIGKWVLAAPFLHQARGLGVAVGAGIFEELLFRGFLCYAVFRTLKDVVGADRFSAGALAVVIAAYLFSAYHHWGAAGEPWDPRIFTFRFHAGVVLGVIFLTRGLGIAALAHGFYDVLVLLG